jgi:hypothetical protein
MRPLTLRRSWFAGVGLSRQLLGCEYNTAMTGNPLIVREERSRPGSSTFSVDAEFSSLFGHMSGCCGSKMGADNAGAIPQRAPIELAEFKCVISFAR